MESGRFQKWEYVFRQLAGLTTGQNLALFDQLDLEILLGTIPEDAKRRFLEKTVLRLTERDMVRMFLFLLTTLA